MLKRKREPEEAQEPAKRPKLLPPPLSFDLPALMDHEPALVMNILVSALTQTDEPTCKGVYDLCLSNRALYAHWPLIVAQSKREFYDPRIRCLKLAAEGYQKDTYFNWPPETPARPPDWYGSWLWKKPSEHRTYHLYRPLFYQWLRLDYPDPVAPEMQTIIKSDLDRNTFKGWAYRVVMNNPIDSPNTYHIGSLQHYHPLFLALRIAHCSTRCSEQTLTCLLTYTDKKWSDSVAAALFYVSYCNFRAKLCAPSAEELPRMIHWLLVWHHAPPATPFDENDDFSCMAYYNQHAYGSRYANENRLLDPPAIPASC